MKHKFTLIVIAILFIGIIGLTIAYYTNTITIENEFGVRTYKTTVGEEFISPDNWLPGDTTSKIVTATNSGQIDQAVRVYYDESWIDSKGNKLPLIQKIDNIGIVSLGIVFFFFNLFISYITNFITTLSDCILVAIFGFIASKFCRVRMKGNVAITLAIYSLTLSVILSIIYTLII